MSASRHSTLASEIEREYEVDKDGYRIRSVNMCACNVCECVHGTCECVYGTCECVYAMTCVCMSRYVEVPQICYREVPIEKVEIIEVEKRVPDVQIVEIEKFVDEVEVHEVVREVPVFTEHIEYKHVPRREVIPVCVHSHL